MPLKASCFTIGMLLCVAISSQANAITDGGFETGSLSDWNSSGATGVTTEADFYGGTAAYNAYPDSNGDYITTFGDSTGSPGSGVIAQDFVTVAGASYALGFEYGAFGASNSGGQIFLEVELIDLTSAASILLETVTDLSPTDDLSVLLDLAEFNFTALGASTQIVFRDVSPNLTNRLVALDNVSVSAVVPEPVSISLMAAAGLLSISRRLRRKQA